MEKLYPPIIEGSLPAFYSDNGTVNITVPFSMNKAVGIDSLKGFSLKIKTVSSNSYILSLKWLDNRSNIADIVLNNCSQLFTADKNRLKDKEQLKLLILTWLNNECLDYDSITSLIKTIISFNSNLLDLKLAKENKNFRLLCVQKNTTEIEDLNKLIQTLNKEIKNLNKTLQENKLELELLQLSKTNKEGDIESLELAITDYENQLSTIDQENNAAEYDRISDLLETARRNLQESEQQLIEITGNIEEQQNVINTLESEIRQKENKRDVEIPPQISRLTTEIESFREEIDINTNNINYLQQILKPVLQQSISSIEAIVEKGSVSFFIPHVYDIGLTVGQHYKLQLAYISKKGLEVGYYSTVGVAKYTTYPNLSIGGLDLYTINPYLLTFTGHYDQTNQDTTEKVYTYQFNLYKNNQLYNSSGWLLHNSSYDDSVSSSFDNYEFQTSLEPNALYQLDYKIKTINNLEASTEKYDIMLQEGIWPETDFSITGKLNFDNAYIDLFLNTENNSASGAFIISRTDSKSNYSDWITLTNLSVRHHIFHNEFIYRDYSIEHGVKYIYSIQQYNANGLFSRHIKTNVIFADFEDMFLFDGEKQLKIKFNPKITSLKQTILESKMETIGSKYPFIFRNAQVSYKEFPISGLISYLSDEEHLFLQSDTYDLIETTTNLTGENINSEKLFKMSVLSWLMNGEKKLFKSPTEGNFIVRLMNVSLSPNEQLGRMLHTFNCTAYEVADFNYNNCKQFGFIKVNNIEKESLVYKTVYLDGVDTTQLNNPFVINPDHDAYSIEFSTTPNAPIIINNSTYFTDNTGYLKFEIDGVTFKAGSILLSYGVSYYGSATYSYKGIPVEGFSNIKNIAIKTMPLRQIEVVDIENNLLDELQDVKNELLSLIYLRAYMKSPDKTWHYIKIDDKNYEFNGRESLLLTNIFEPQTIFASDENMIIECGYQYCEKIFFIEEEENIYNELINVLNEKHLEQFLKEYLQAQEDASDNYFVALYDLHNQYLNEEIKTEEEYQERLQSLQDTYKELLDNIAAEEDYIETMEEIRNEYNSNINAYYDNLREMLNQGVS